jgi:hypothetical protein
MISQIQIQEIPNCSHVTSSAKIGSLDLPPLLFFSLRSASSVGSRGFANQIESLVLETLNIEQIELR